VATLEDLEARVAALEASHADYRAVLAAVNALGANQREHSVLLGQLRADVADGVRLTDARFRSIDEQLVEIKDLLVERRDR
jgi:hypothetical protein